MAASQPIGDDKFEKALMTDLWTPEIADDPRAFVRYVYPWGKPNTPLANQTGPKNWQDKDLKEIADYVKSAKLHQQMFGEVPDMFRSADASGRGIGKSAKLSWLAHWLVSTRLGSSVWVTANGEPQLKTKTFPEISKWVSMSINSHWFDINVTSILPAKWLTDLVTRDLKIDPRYWYIAAQLWSEENPDAFAGAHNINGEMYLFDEASGIPASIWTVAQGVFTEQTIFRFWLAFSQARRNDGAFFECFHKNRDLWRVQNINALDVEGISHDAHRAIIKEHGEDSDEARTEVYGLFPNQADDQFIGFSTVDEAMVREVVDDPGAPLLMAIDVARGTRDYNVFGFRQGRNARVLPWERFHSTDTTVVAAKAAEAIEKFRVDAVFVDGGGVGGPVVDMLKAMKFRVIEVQSGGSPNDENKYLNKRAENWALMKEWLGVGAIWPSKTMRQDLTGPKKEYHPVSGKFFLESKEKMLKRGLASPDEGDTLSMTFNCPIARTDRRSGMGKRRNRQALATDYSMFS